MRTDLAMWVEKKRTEVDKEDLTTLLNGDFNIARYAEFIIKHQMSNGIKTSSHIQVKEVIGTGDLKFRPQLPHYENPFEFSKHMLHKLG